MKLALYIIIVVMCGLLMCAGELYDQNQSLQAQLDQVPEIEDFQRKIGAKPDGILGPNMQLKWEQARGNQHYKLYNTPTGAPIGDE